jgi:23S rRNA pseudouridine2605 synthase
VRLARALSKLGIATRSEAIALVLAGRVQVDGAIVRDPGRLVVPDAIDLAIDAERRTRAVSRTIALHKPRGVVTTKRDPEGRPTVYDLIADAGPGLAPIGRLDLATSGLLLCTSDTHFGAWLTDPASGVEREYVVTVRGRVDAADAAALTRGLDVQGTRLVAQSVEVRKATGRETHLRVVLTEGKNREVRRLFEAIGHEVTRLMRVRIGGLVLGDLAAGRWRPLSKDVVRTAFPEYPDRRSAAPIGRRPRVRAHDRGDCP